MKLTSESFIDGAAIPAEFCFAAVDAVDRLKLSTNRNPHFAWSEAPEGVKSFALICHDPDAPASREGVNTDGRVVPGDAPRADFFHWSLLDIPATASEILAGAHSDGVTPRGKLGPAASDGMRHGVNSYTEWLADDDTMTGTYFGYDGPCPPWNDSIVHRYVFTLYALASETIQVDGAWDGGSVLAAVENAQILATARLTGTYTLNPDVAL